MGSLAGEASVREAGARRRTAATRRGWVSVARVSGALLLALALGCGPGADEGAPGGRRGADPDRALRVADGRHGHVRAEHRPRHPDGDRGDQRPGRRARPAPLELISEDDRSITEEARTAAQKLLQRDEVVALLGEVASSRSLAAAPEAQRARVPMISPSSTNPKVTEVGDYIFRVCFIDPFQGAVMARFALRGPEGDDGRDPVRLQAGLLGRPRRVLPQDVHGARRRDRRRRALHRAATSSSARS